VPNAHPIDLVVLGAAEIATPLVRARAAARLRRDR
jgi:hypothetical protein